MKKTFLFVDGSNLYGTQYKLFGPDSFLDFPSFINELENIINDKFTEIYVYASYSPKPENATKKQLKYLTNEGLFYKYVKSEENTTFFKGYRSKTSGKEKEVDVKLAVDIVDFAHRNKYKRAYLLSGDADFLHALFAAQKLKKEIRLICVSPNIMYKAMHYFPTYTIAMGNTHSITSTDKSPIKVTLPKKLISKSI